MIEYAPDKCCGSVTERTIEHRWNVSRRLADGVDTVARSTIIDDAGVIERRRDKCGRVVTYAAILIRFKMVNALAGGKSGIMTRCAVVDDANMIEACGQEPGRHVTVIAITVGRHMVRRLACRSGAVMTRFAVANDALMVKPGAGKARGDVAIGAILCRRNGNMILRQAGCINAVMA